MLKKLLYIIVSVCSMNSQVSAQKTSTLSTDEKLYGLSKFWSEANYNFVYMYKVDPVQWDSAYRAAITNVQTTEDDFSYYRELQKLCGILKDGHTQVFLPDAVQEKLMTTNFGKYRIFLSYIEGRVVVSNVNRSMEKEIPVGSQVISVNGYPVDQYQQKFVKPFLSTSTENAMNHKAAFNLLTGFDGDSYEIVIRDPRGRSKKIALTHSKTQETELSINPEDNQGNFEFRWLRDKTAYVALRSFEDAGVVDGFESMIEELKKAERIILDVRDNGGGSGKNAINIAKYFVVGDTLFGARNSSRSIVPTERAIGSFLTAQDTINGKTQWGLSKDETTELFNAYAGTKFHHFPYKPSIVSSKIKLKVPTAVLTNANTASAAEDFLIFLDGVPHIKRVGDHTNGSTGQPLQITLPGNASAWICTKKVTFPSGEEFVGIGIKPHILVPREVNDIIRPDRHDSQLDAALRYLRSIQKN